MPRSFTSLFVSAVPVSCAAFWLAACAATLGPGYIVETQEIRVSFAPQPAPMIHVSAEYRLKNTGNQELSSLDVRLPGRRFHPADLAIAWDAAALSHEVSPENPRDVQLLFPQTWTIGAPMTFLQPALPKARSVFPRTLSTCPLRVGLPNFPRLAASSDSAASLLKNGNFWFAFRGDFWFTPVAEKNDMQAKKRKCSFDFPRILMI